MTNQMRTVWYYGHKLCIPTDHRYVRADANGAIWSHYGDSANTAECFPTGHIDPSLAIIWRQSGQAYPADYNHLRGY